MPQERDLIQKKPSKQTDVQTLIDKGVLPEEIQTVREIVNDFNGDELTEFNDGIIYRAYHAALRCRTQSLGIIAKKLGISRKVLEYYLKQYPKLGLAIQVGYMDAVDYLKEDLVSALTRVALGTTTTEITKYEKQYVNKYGDIIDTEDTKTITKELAPDVTAIIELMKRLDPAWQPKVSVDIQQEVSHTFNVKEDINVAVDYRKLSPSALRELIQSSKSSPNSQPLQVDEEGKSVRLKAKPVQDARRAISGDNKRKAPSPGARVTKNTIKLSQQAPEPVTVKTRKSNKVNKAVNTVIKGDKQNEQSTKARKRGRPRKSDSIDR